MPNGGWAEYGPTQPNALQVVGGQAVVGHTSATSQDVLLPFTNNTPAGIMFYAFDFSVDDLGAPVSAVNDDYEYFATFYNGVGGDNLSARMDIVAPTGIG